MNQLATNVVAIQDKPLSATDIRQQVNTIQHVMKEVMLKDTHYGVIPGTKTPSLYKPGAEKIMATFRLSADPEVSDLSDGDQIRYQVKVRLVSPTGIFVGAGIGECSSNEEKFKWRNAVCNEEFEETPPDRKREKWSKGYRNEPAYKRKQIRTEPADLANTVLKMAKKRALVDAVLTATAASDIFTQDIEDLPAEYIDANQDIPPADPEPDITDWLSSIQGCATMEDLQKVFTDAYTNNKGFKGNLRRITEAKDAKKKQLAEVANG
jgi:hypothetical protein